MVAPSTSVPRAAAGRRHADLLRVPLLGHFLRWKHARTSAQVVTLLVAALILYDGFFGPQVAPENLAGVIPWVHWRGLVVLALLIAGNLFCFACPFMLPRRLAKRLLPANHAWPARLRGKWLAVALLLVFFWAYEAFDIWASPWLTAWVAVAYFAGAFVIDGFFRGAAFCKYVCPIGQFHFVNGMVAPLEVGVRRPATCTACTTKDCIRGRYAEPLPASAHRPNPLPTLARPPANGATSASALSSASVEVPGHQQGVLAATTVAAQPTRSAAATRGSLVQSGCELWLFQERKVGNLDCTFCLDCVQACPHDNVGILTRPRSRDLRADERRSSIGRLAERPDLAALVLVLVFGAFVNAFGMVRPVYALQQWLADRLGTTSEALVLTVLFGVGMLILPLLLVGGAALVTKQLSGSTDPPLTIATRYAYALIPLGFAMWLAHYGFHFATGALTLVPVMRDFLRDVGLPAPFDVGWAYRSLIPLTWLATVEMLILLGGWLGSASVAQRISWDRRDGRGLWPWIALVTLLLLAGMWLMQQPMEMRGSFLG